MSGKIVKLYDHPIAKSAADRAVALCDRFGGWKVAGTMAHFLAQEDAADTEHLLNAVENLLTENAERRAKN